MHRIERNILHHAKQRKELRQLKNYKMKHLKNNIKNIQLAGALIGVNWYEIHDLVDRKTLHNVPAQKWLYKHIKDHFGTEILDKKMFM